MAEQDDLDTSELLLWRLDPAASHSDWTVIVPPTAGSDPNNADSSTRYHVHKSFLGIGAYRSEFFAAEFQREGATGTTTLRLATEAERMAFEPVLDFVYSRGLSLIQLDRTEHQTIQMMHSLADTLGMPKLSTSLHRWHATLTQDDTRQRRRPSRRQSLPGSTSSLAKKFESLPQNQFLAFPLEQFQEVLEHMNLVCEPTQLCKRICTYCKEHVEEIDAVWLSDVTNLLPTIAVDVALDFLHVALTVLSNDDDDDDDVKELLQPLQEKCKMSIAQYWNALLLAENANPTFESLPDEGLKRDILTMALQTASNDVDRTLTDLDACRGKQVLLHRMVHSLKAERELALKDKAIQDVKLKRLQHDLDKSEARCKELQDLLSLMPKLKVTPN